MIVVRPQQLPGPCHCNASHQNSKYARNFQVIALAMALLGSLETCWAHPAAIPANFNDCRLHRALSNLPVPVIAKLCVVFLKPAWLIQLPIPASSNDCLRTSWRCHTLRNIQVIAIAMLLLGFLQLLGSPSCAFLNLLGSSSCHFDPGLDGPGQRSPQLVKLE